MGGATGEVLTFAVGVAISPVPIIAVILMLFSKKAAANGPLFLLGWVVALATVSGAVYALGDAGDAATNATASDTISWGKIALGTVLLLLALRNWRNRLPPGAEPEMPKWMGTIDTLTPSKAFALGLLLAGVNPKNLILTVGAATGVAELGVSACDAAAALIVFVVVASATITGPVVYYRVGGEHAKSRLDSMKAWLSVHNVAVMAVLFLVFGTSLIATGLPPLTS